MDYQTLLDTGGHADQHATKTMQEIAGALIALCESRVTSLVLNEDEETLQDWNRQCLMQCGDKTIKVWIELSSDGANHPGEYCFRCLAQVDSVPVDVGFNTAQWTSGANEAGIDALISQLSQIEMSVVTIARTVQGAM